ncbi:zeta toxin family protein (plasmid) [Rhodococcus globerulus]|uniref:zeta toxin family protein n=1 Tax=Rhodococcus globerulus TaxID=33008 RepID=UPI0039EB9D62
MSDDDQLRAAVGTQLAALCSEGGVLRSESPASTKLRYRINDPSRTKFHRQVFADYLATNDGPAENGSAIVMAGVPGAGKSTMLKNRVDDLGGYRLLDADIVKVPLIERALTDGIYDDLLGRTLADGHTIAPMELAALVHRESTDLIDIIREDCLSRRENVIIEGTLTWPGQGETVFDQLAAAGYSRIIVLGVEVEPRIAHHQATSRWWEGRRAWCSGENALGGRFTPPYAIDDGYDSGVMSRCSRHALRILDRARGGEIDLVDVTIYSPSGFGQYEVVAEGKNPEIIAPH